MKNPMIPRAAVALAVTVAAGAALLAGCSKGADSSAQTTGPSPVVAETGTLRITLADAPYPFDLIDKAELTIDRISVHMQGTGTGTGGDDGGADVDSTETGDDHGGADMDSTDTDSTEVHTGGADAEDGESGDDDFIVLSRDVQTVDLADLRNGVSRLLVESDVPAGTIDQVRLHVTVASVTLTDGRVFDLTIPSGDESGLKVFATPPIAVVGNLTTDLLLDADMSRSFLAIPATATKVDDIRGFHFHPTLRVANLSSAGSISGVVVGDQGTPSDASDDTPIPGATVTAVAADGTTYSTASDTDGSFRLMGLPEGTYSLTVSAADHADGTASVAVVAGNDAGGTDFLLVQSTGP